jgi:shikimate 5-dehydrogenase
MAVTINKDTKLYGSFSTNPGNNGCLFFNDAFEKFGINAIYKSYYSDDIEKLISSVKYLKFSGFALSMPHKIEIYDYLDEWDESVIEIGACNTVVVKDGKLHGYNTDWLGVKGYFLDATDSLTILGDGGFSKAVQYLCRIKNIQYQVITRKDWDKIYDLEGYVFNATPIDIATKGILIDGRPSTDAGKIIAKLQAIEQFKIYTGIDYDYYNNK